MGQNLSLFMKPGKIVSYVLIITTIPFFLCGKSDQNSFAVFPYQNNFHVSEEIKEKQKSYPQKVDTYNENYAEIINTRVICKQPGKYIGWPSITQTRSGELLVVFSGNRDAHVCPFGITQMIRSTDNGETWRDPETINNTPLDDRDAGILETKNGTLLVNWFTSLAFDTKKYYDRNPSWKRHADKLGDETKKYWIGNWTRRSLNGGQSWEEPVKQVVSAPHGAIELSDGRLLYVGTGYVNNKKIIGVEQSIDDGQSWQLLSTIPLKSEDQIAFSHEPHVVELSDGKLVAMFRYNPTDHNQSYLRQSESYDGGRTWTTSHKTGIWGYPPHLMQLKNGWLLVSYGVRREPFGEKACISKDGGKTWETDKEIMINPSVNSDLGYPASVQLDDGSILTVYYQVDKEGEKTSLMSTHWCLKESGFSSVDKKDIVNIGSRLELFIDTFLIEKQINVQRILHEPEDEGIVLFFDKPWEGPFCGYATIIKDNAKYRLYYRGLPEAGKDGSTLETTCYAESDDGINWTKPNIGIYEISGTYNNNVILANDAPYSHNFCPFLDSKPGIQLNEKFKAVAGTKKTGLIGFLSADGIHWSDPVEMAFGETPKEHLYTNQTHPYFRAPHIYVAIAARFMPKRQVLTEKQAQQLNVNPKYFKDCSDVILMTSRGGSNYDRSFMEAFIKPGIGLQNWVSRSNYPVLNIVQTGSTEMSVYVNQNYAQPTSHLRRYSLRIDGFISITAPYKGGELLTKPFIFDGKNLFLNFATSASGGV